MIGRGADGLPVLLAALRAWVDGPWARPCWRQGARCLAADLRAARFGVAVWSAAELDALTIEMLCGLVDDLNAATRFSGLSLAPGDNALGVLQTCGWMTGFPMRTGFARGHPEHDPWRYDAARLVDSGEADGALWISAYRAAAPAVEAPSADDRAHGAGASFGTRRGFTSRSAARDRPRRGRALRLSGTLVPIVATAPSKTISVADAISHIAAALPSAGASPC